jgi:hypothetical protein
LEGVNEVVGLFDMRKVTDVVDHKQRPADRSGGCFGDPQGDEPVVSSPEQRHRSSDLEQSLDIRSPRSFSAVFQLGGAVADADEDATAYSHRAAAHNININAAWLPGEPVAEEEIAWAQAFFAALEPYQTGAYVNFLDRDDEDRVRIAYGADMYRRLVELKNRYDPANVFA